MAGEARSYPGVPLGMGGDPEPCTGRCDEHYYILRGHVRLGRRVIVFNWVVLGPRWKLLLVQEWTQPTHRGCGVGGLLKNHHIVHRVAGCVCCDCHNQHAAVVYREVVDGKESKTECAIVLSSHPLEIDVCERNVLSGFRVPQHSASPNQRRQFYLT